MEKQKKQAPKRKLEVISFPESQKTKDKVNLEKSVSQLVKMARELEILGRKTGQEGLPETVYLSFMNVLMDAVHLAVRQERRDRDVLGD